MVGKNSRRRRDRGAAGRGDRVGSIEDDYLVATAGGKEGIGGCFLFVAVDRIFEGGHGPEPHARIPIHGDKFTEAR